VDVNFWKRGVLSSIGNSDSGKYLQWHRCWYCWERFIFSAARISYFLLHRKKKPKWDFSRLSLQHYCQGCYGNFIWYHVEPSDTHQATSITATPGSPNAFSVLMSSQWEIQFMQHVSSPRNIYTHVLYSCSCKYWTSFVLM